MRCLLCLIVVFIATSVQGEPMKVVAANTILADMTREIGGASVEVTSLIPAGGDAHDFQPAPRDAARLGKARVFIVNGLGLEGWARKLAEAGGFKGGTIVASEGVTALAAEEDHDHGGAGHDHGEGADPHAWQDVANARRYVANIARGLALADPTSADRYRDASAAYDRRLEDLDAKVRAMIATVPEAKRKVITNHDAFHYYGKAYGVTFLAAVGVSEEAEPSAKAIAALEKQIRAEKIKAIFLEAAADPRLVRILAREAGATLGPELYADSLSKPDGPAPSYIDMVTYNTRVLVEGMQRN